jgi:hypothetical protein
MIFNSKNNINWNVPLYKVNYLNGSSYIVKIEEVQNHSDIKSYTCFSDLNIDLFAYNVHNKKNIIGYIISIKEKNKFKILLRDHYIQIIDKEIKKHNNSQLIYCTKKVHLYKFNGDLNSSYWFTCRLPGTAKNELRC